MRSRLAARLTAPPAAPADPSICAFTMMFWPADAFSDEPLRVFSTGALIVTSFAAARSTRPVVPSMIPSTDTEPPVDVAARDPPLMPPVVTLPPAVIAIGAFPDTSAVPFAIVAAPVVAVMPIAPLLVPTELFSATSRAPVSVTAPPVAPPRPSIAAFTTTSRPAVAVKAAPLRGLRTAALMFTSDAAFKSTLPVLPSMTPLTFTAPPVEVAVKDPPAAAPVVRSPAARIVCAAVPEKVPLPAATVAAPLLAVRSIVPLFVST